MKNCKYIIKTENEPPKELSYIELYSLLLNNPELTNDIIFSKDDGQQKAQDLIEQQSRYTRNKHRLPKDGKFDTQFKTEGVEIIDGNAELKTSSDEYTMSGFFDSGLYIDKHGNLIVLPYDKDKYLERLEQLYRQDLSLTEDNIKQKLVILETSRSRISKDCSDLHRIVMRIPHPDIPLGQVDKIVLDTESFKNHSKKMKEVADEIRGYVRRSHSKYSKEAGDTSTISVYQNIDWTSELLIKSKDKNKLTLHTDYVVVNPDGSIDVYNIKGTHEAPVYWDREKKWRYKNEFALLAKIMQSKGLPIDKIRFHIIPAILHYDEQFLNINDVEIQEPICYSHRNGGFVMYNELLNASMYIDMGDSVTLELKDNNSINLVDVQLQAIFPENGVFAKGILLSLKNYVDKNWEYWKMSSELPDKGWVLVIDGVIYRILDSREGSENKELLDKLSQVLKDLLSNNGNFGATNIISKLKQFRRGVGTPMFDTGYLNNIFYKYFDHDIQTVYDKKSGEEIEKKIYKWKIVENEILEKCNVILFKSIDGQIDIVTLSEYDLYNKVKLNGRNNILGYHLSDLQAKDNLGKELLKATFGNLELMRTMFLVNELIPSLGEDVKLGNILVIGGLGTKPQSLSYPVLLIISNFVKAILIYNSKEPNKVSNNFSSIKNVSPVHSLISEFWEILKESPNLKSSNFENLKDIISGLSAKGIHLTDGTIIDSLASADSTEVLILRLEELILRLSTILTNLCSIKLNEEAIISAAKLDNKSKKLDLTQASARMFIQASITLDRLYGIIRVAESDLSDVERYLARPLNISNPHVRIVSKLLLDAIHTMSNKLEPIINDFNKICSDYYKEKGYSRTRNFLVGDLSNVFKHLYKENTNDLIFKDPYDPNEELDDIDRLFLKHVLYEINKVRYKNEIVPEPNEDLKIKEFRSEGKHKNYLLVPLEKASQSTRWTNPKNFFKDFLRRVKDYVKNPSKFFKEMYEYILDEALERLLREDIDNLQAHNRFRISESIDARQNMLARFKKHYFETNIQNLVIDYIYKDLLEQEMNKMLIKTRGILLWLKMCGISEDDRDKFLKVVNHINDYLKTSVFNKSIISEDLLKVLTKLQPLRTGLSSAYIALNPVAAIRDTIGGFMSNIVRSITKFRTDIDPKDILWSYKFVLGLGMHSAMDIDLMDKLNSKYLISNINIEQLQEGYKTNREGITNVGSWAFATLRKPDYLNRMVLFVSKLKHDGSIDAYSVDSNGNLRYNWRMDKRFNLLASNNLSNLEEYNKQKVLYLSLLKLFNEENPNANLLVRLETELPDGYTQNQIDTIKHLADTIYGSYNKSTKSMYEFMAIGSQFGIFSTWMNGLYDVYFGSKRESSYETETIQVEDENGNKLFITKDGNLTTEDTGVPYLKDIPILVLGVMYTMLDVVDAIYRGDFRNLIWNDPMLMRNIKRLLSDILMSFLLYMLFNEVVDPSYKTYKKEADGNNVILNMIVELVYRGSSSSFEEFKGPFPIIDYVMNNTSPSSVKWGSRMVVDVGNTIFGDATFGETIVKSLALPRAFLDTYKMYLRDTKNGVEE